MPVNPRRLLPPLLLLAASACSSSSTSPGGATDGGSTPPPGDGGGGTDGASSGADSASPPAGYTLTLAGMNYAGTGIAIAPQMSAGGVYQGYYVAESDQGASPSLSVSIKAPSATLAAGTSYACDRSSAGDGVETSVLVHWLDGHTYSTNVLPNPTCKVDITAASQSAVSANVSGTIFDETDSNHPSVAFTATFDAPTKP